MWRYLPDLPPDTPETWRVCDGFHPDRNGIYRTGFMAASYSDYGAENTAVFGKAYRTAAGAIGIAVVVASATTPKVYIWNGAQWWFPRLYERWSFVQIQDILYRPEKSLGFVAIVRKPRTEPTTNEGRS